MSQSNSSERQPLLPQHTQNIANKAQQYVPDKNTRFSIANAFGALQAGKLPTQQQLDALIDALNESDVLKSSSPTSRTARLSDDGARTVQDLQRLLKSLKALGDEKNSDNKIQEFIYNTITLDVDIDAATKPSNRPSRRQLNQDADEAIASIRTLAKLVLTSSEFRNMLSDLVFVARDIFADAAVSVADKAKAAADKSRPSEKEREQGVDWEKVQRDGKGIKAGLESGRIQGQAQARAGLAQEQAKQYYDEQLSSVDEAKEQLIERLKRIVTQTQKDPEYQDAVRTLVSLAQKYTGTSKAVLDSAIDGTKINDEDAHAQEALGQLRSILETFAGKNLEPVLEAASKVLHDIQKDDRLSSYFRAIGDYLDRLLYDPGWVTTHRAYNRGSELYDRGQELLTSDAKWKADAEALQRETEAFVNALKYDQATERVLDDIVDLSDSLNTLTSSAASQLRIGGIGIARDFFDIVLPRIVATIKEIPLPRTEYKSEDIDLVIDDVVFESASFIPDNIRFVNHNDLSLTQGYAAYSTDLDSSVRLHVDGLRLNASNISYWFNKKTGFFPYEDSGLLDVSIGGKGLSFDVKLENASEENRETFFVVSKVNIDLSALEFSVKQNDHWFLTFFGKPFLRSLIEHNLTVMLEGQISSYLKSLDFELYALQQRAIAATNARPSSINDYLRAIFSTSVLPAPKGRSKVTQRGIVRTGPRGRYVLAIGVDEQLFPGKAGKGDAHDKRRNIRKAVENVRDSVAGQANGTGAEARREGTDLDRARRDALRAERRKDGWKSNAFDL